MPRRGSLGRNAPSIAAVVGLHLLLGWALVSGLARQVVDVIRAPLEARIVQEVHQPPPDLPPPPPPKLAAPPPPFIPPPEINIQVPQTAQAPTITAVTRTPPPPTPVIRPTPPPAPPQPVVRREYKASYRVEPTFPRRAIQLGLSGRVVAWVHVAPSGAVTNVEIRQTSNPLFDREVVRTLSQWKFNPEPVGFIGEYEISFRLKD